MRRCFLVFLLLPLAPCAARAQTIIPDYSTAPRYEIGWAMYDRWGGEYVNGALTGGYAFGETFTVPEESHLVRFAEQIGPACCGPTPSLAYRWYISEWRYLDDTSGETLGVLWRSDPLVGMWESYLNMDLDLRPGAVYAFFAAPEPSIGQSYTGSADLMFDVNYDLFHQGRAYPEGGLITRRFDVPTDLGHTRWDVDMEERDAFFSMTFTSTPEPMSMGLISLGLAGVGLLRRRQRRAG